MFSYWYIFRSYYFALKIIFTILNKFTQYISFVAITLFITFFLLIKQGLGVYEDIFINSLKGLYPEFITSSTSVAKKLKSDYKDKIVIKDEIFVYSEEIEFSYNGKDSITKFMNVRTYDNQFKDKLFNSLKVNQICNETPDTIWISSRLYKSMSEDAQFNKHSLFFKDEDDNFIEYPICVFELDNGEKWLLTSTSNAKKIAYMPFSKKVIYTNDKKIKNELYKVKKVDNWKKYIDYDDLGLFLLAKDVSNVFLIAFFVFLITFMLTTFSSVAKEFETSIFLIKLYGLNFYRSVVLYTFFFFIYTIAVALFVYIEYNLITYIASFFVSVDLSLNLELFKKILEYLIVIGFFVSLIITIKYHRLPL